MASKDDYNEEDLVENTHLLLEKRAEKLQKEYEERFSASWSNE